MDILLVSIFLLLGIVFFLLEIFFLPGISIGGVAGTVFVVAGVWYAFAQLGTTAGWLTLAIGAIAFALAVWLFIRARVLERISLTTQLKSDGENNAVRSSLAIGDTGRTISRLAPMGRAFINGIDVEVKAQEQLVDAGVEVQVVAFDDKTPVVKPAC